MNCLRIIIQKMTAKDGLRMKIDEFMLKMRDGIRLQTFTYSPAGGGLFPSLLACCIYGTEKIDAKARFWANKGYVVVLQNVRGRNKSEGGPVSRNITPKIVTTQWNGSLSNHGVISLSER